VEERLRFVARPLDGEAMTELCREYRPAERFEHQNNIQTVAMMRKLGVVLKRRPASSSCPVLSDRAVPDVPVAHHASSL